MAQHRVKPAPGGGGQNYYAGVLRVVADSNIGRMPFPSATSSASATAAPTDQLVQAVMGASRALVAVAARSLAGVAADVTLPQYRVLVELAAHGPQRAADLASALAVERSTMTRMCDRLVRKHLVQRRRTSADRRVVRMSLTRAGRELVEEVIRRRRVDIERIVRRLPATDRVVIVEALLAFSDAAGELPEQDWSLGWGLEE